MTVLYKVKTTWSGFGGANGYTNLFFETSDPITAGALAAVTNVGLFWYALKSYVPSTVTWTVDPSVETINDEDGSLNSIVDSGFTGSPNTANGSGSYGAPAGAAISWQTGAVYGGHRVIGRTFIVPLAAASYDSAGALSGTARTGINSAATALRTATGPTLGVWSRPVHADPFATPPVAGRAGRWFPSTSSSVAAKVAVLRSRRD